MGEFLALLSALRFGFARFVNGLLSRRIHGMTVALHTQRDGVVSVVVIVVVLTLYGGRWTMPIGVRAAAVAAAIVPYLETTTHQLLAASTVSGPSTPSPSAPPAPPKAWPAPPAQLPPLPPRSA